MRFHENLGVREDNLRVVIQWCYMVTVDQFNSVLLFRANLSHDDLSVGDRQCVIFRAMKQLNR